MAETLPAASKAIDDRFDNKTQNHNPSPIIPEAKAAEKNTSSFSDAQLEKGSITKPELKIDIPIPDQYPSSRPNQLEKNLTHLCMQIQSGITSANCVKI